MLKEISKYWMGLGERFSKEPFIAWSTVFTGFLVLFTFMLVRVTDKMDETSRESQRAFIAIKTIQFVAPKIDATTDVTKVAFHEFMAVWENSGTTPTKKALAYANYQARTDPLPEDFTYPDSGDQKLNPLVVGAKGIVYAGPLDIPVGDIQAKKHLYFWGWMAYYDVFKGSPMHLTEFCYEARFVGNPAELVNPRPVETSAWFFTTCDGHNCYDEECRDYSSHLKQTFNPN